MLDALVGDVIAPTVAGAPEAIHPPAIVTLLAGQRHAGAAGDLDRVNAIKARLSLDGPLAEEGRVGGVIRRLFLDMNAIALRSPSTGSNLDTVPAYDRVVDLRMPAHVLWGELDFPHIQERSHAIARRLPNGSGHALHATAHLPSLDRPADITRLVADFADLCLDHTR